MNLIIPFESEVKFDNVISEILSISLEHDYTVNEGKILGNFTISGEYKSHEVSVNKDTFNFVLPFEVDIPSNIDKDSIDFSIDDFTYELVEKDTLKVNIEYKVCGEEAKIESNIEEELNELIEEDNRDIKVDDTIISETSSKEDTFITYNIYIYKETDTIESVCSKYNIGIDTLKEYNDITNISNGDKLIIPEYYE